MSGSIGRSYLIQQWNDASSYSGEMIGNRLKESTDLYLANGKANTGLFAEEEPKKTGAKPKHIRDKILPQNTTLNRLDLQEKELDEAYLAEEIDDNEYLELSRALEAKRVRAHKSLMRALGLSADAYENSLENGDEGEEVGQHRVEGERTSNTPKSLLKDCFSGIVELVRKGSYREWWESAKKVSKNPTIIFLTRCSGLAILLITASKY